MENKESTSSCSAGQSVQERGLPYVPDCYATPSAHCPSLAPQTHVPIIDLARLREGEEQRSMVIKELRNTCSRMGFFQIVNHGISQSILDEALSVAFDFFKLPTGEKLKLMSNDVHKPVRYGTSIKDGVDENQFCRALLKHYAHPLDAWIDSWPENPPYYRKTMGKYCTEVRKLALELMGAITESLGLGPKYLSNKMDEGMQVMAINYYPPCPEPDIVLGSSP